MVGPHYFRRIDLEFPAEKRQEIVKNVQMNAPKELEGSPVVKVDTFDGTRFTAEDGSWLLIRFSGTEPLLRTYSESSSPERVERLLALARKVAGLE
jgi:phosphomannomutase